MSFTSAIPAGERLKLTRDLERLIEPPGFTGSAPGGPSRWNTERSMAWKPLRPVLVVEVRYDQVTARRFRHGTGFLRWRPIDVPGWWYSCRLFVAAGYSSSTGEPPPPSLGNPSRS